MRPEGPVLLYGAGREGKSTSKLLAEMWPDLSVEVCVDSGTAEIPDAKQVSVAEAVKKRYGLVVRSAGVSIYKPELAALREAGASVTTNVNLWAEHRRGAAKVIAITGTKGKSTTAKLTHGMLAESGIDAGLGGNIGVPPLDLGKHDWVVLELSSYQIADLDLEPDLIGITTLYPEHLDWHQSTKRYYADKLHILDMKGDWQVAAGPQAASHAEFAAKRVPARRLLPALMPDFEEEITDAARGSRLRGMHNLDNAILAARLALAAGANEAGILAAIKAFEPLPHRLQEIEVSGISFVDDSIATTPAATEAALNAYPIGRVALIAGGHDRGQDYESLAAQIARSNVGLVATLPVTGKRLAEALRAGGAASEIIEAPNLESAMRQLADRRGRFDIVLLSPGAPSFGQFRDFEERGEKFIEFARHYFR